MLFSFLMILNMYNLYVQLNSRSPDIFNLLSTLKEMVVSCFYTTSYMISRVGKLTGHPALGPNKSRNVLPTTALFSLE